LIRRSLHFELHQSVPDHSRVTVIRQRIGSDVLEQVFELIPNTPCHHRLLRGWKLDIYASWMGANPSLCQVENRPIGEDYRT